MVEVYEKLVKNKFELYNSLFLNLPFPGIKNIGILIPLLQQSCLKGLWNHKSPIQILDEFFNTHTDIKSEEDKVQFMLKIIQYIERQIVLFDSVEDSAFYELKELENNLSIKDYFQIAVNKKSPKKLLNKLSEFSVRFVFTAHPTQFYSSSVLGIIDRLREYISNNDINKIDITLQQLGLTSLINSKKPTPLDEAKNILFFFRHVYYDAAGEFYSHIKNAFLADNFDNPSLIHLGFWPGGDRDGNPFVNADTTLAVADELRMALMKCYYRDITNLEQKLTFKGVVNIIENLKLNIYKSMFDPLVVLKYKNIISPLLEIRDYLIKEYNSIYLSDIDSLIEKVNIFKTHFAGLDIRQNHSIHKNNIEAILLRENILEGTLDELSQRELINLLVKRNIRIDAAKYNSTDEPDTIKTISVLKSIQKKNGESGCNRYIISNSEDIFSVLFVFGMFRWVYNSDDIPFDIIPLFETMSGMLNAHSVMEELFNIPEYKKHLKKRSNTQTIMLGFSDGTKDGGYLKANWEIFKTKEVLSGLCKKHDIKVIFFDGRGGPPARGGGKSHRFYASQSNLIADNAIQLTIQGQTISSKFGTKEQFKNNCEQIITAGISHSMSEKDNQISAEMRNLIEQLAEISYKKYLSLKNHSMFLLYLENRSTLKYYGETKIGSRPVKRNKSKKIEFTDLRAIPFVGAWSQLKQNVPGYYGIGTALKTLIGKGKLSQLQKLFNDVPFFKALILNSMMSLSKTNFNLTAYMAGDKIYGEFWNILFEEYKLSKQLILKITGNKDLMEEESLTKSSIEVRENIVLPLLTIQQYAMQKIENGSKHKSLYEKIVKRSLYGNINASRNSV